MKKLQHTILLILIPISISAQRIHWQEETITVEDGLVSDGVRCMLKDSQGFMWFGTDNGLQRYDGYQFKSITGKSDGMEKLPALDIRDLAEDRSKNILIATFKGGLYRYDPMQEIFTHYLHEPNDVSCISSNKVERVYVDKAGTVWVGTNQGINRFDHTQSTFSRYYCNPDTSRNAPGNDISCIYEDKSGRFWIGTRNHGLYLMNRQRGTFRHFPHVTADDTSIKNFITCTYEDRDGVLWVATLDGMYQFSPATKIYNRVLYNPGNSSFPENQQFTAIVEDSKGNYWIRTYDGLYHYNKALKLLDSYQNASRAPIPNLWKNLKTILPDSSGSIWYSQHYRGIRRLSPKTKKFRFYEANPGMEEQAISSIFIENKDIIWMGTSWGLSRYDRKNNEYKLFRHDPDNPSSISNGIVSSILRDQYGSLWIGTYIGLNRLVISESKAYRFIRYQHDPYDPSSIDDDEMTNMVEGPDGRLYIDLAYDQIDLYDRKIDSFLHLRFPYQRFREEKGYIQLIEPGKMLYVNAEGILEIRLPLVDRDSNQLKPVDIIKYDCNATHVGSLNVNRIERIFKDSRGTYWIIHNKGLSKWVGYNGESKDSASCDFIHYSKENGLANEVIVSIIEDNGGNLWLGTQNGLSKFNPTKETFTNYNRDDGLACMSFNKSAFKAPDGELFFTTVCGLQTFYPDSIKDNPFIPPIVITEIRIFNKSLPVGGNSPLKKSISFVDEIELPFNRNFFPSNLQPLIISILSKISTNTKWKDSIRTGPMQVLDGLPATPTSNRAAIPSGSSGQTMTISGTWKALHLRLRSFRHGWGYHIRLYRVRLPSTDAGSGVYKVQDLEAQA